MKFVFTLLLTVTLFSSFSLIANSDQEGGAVAVLPISDGTYLVTGSSTVPSWRKKVSLARYLPDGTLDILFGTGGKVLLDLSPYCDNARAIHLQPDGKILIVGTQHYRNGCPSPKEYFHGFIARFHFDGQLDTSFGNQGFSHFKWKQKSTHVTDLVVTGGKIYVSGHRGKSFSSAHGQPFVVRLNLDGSNDSTFANNGVLDVPLCQGFAGCKGNIKRMLLGPAGKHLYLGGAQFGAGTITYYAQKLTLDGKPDLSFGMGDGIARVAIGGAGRGAEAMVVSSLGFIYLMGSGGNQIVITKLDSKGIVDRKFGGSGRLIVKLGESVHQARKLRIDGKGRILAVASVFKKRWSSDIGIVRFFSDGKLDPAFWAVGKVRVPIGQLVLANDLQVDPNGHLIAVGNVSIQGGKHGAHGLARLLDDGSLDPNFGSQGVVIEPMF